MLEMMIKDKVSASMGPGPTELIAGDFSAGLYGVSLYDQLAENSSDKTSGWRPVLELMN